jgi:hypothetical protein
MSNFKVTRLDTIIEVRCKIGDFVSEIDYLRFQGGTLIKKIFAELWIGRGRIVPRMFDDTFAGSQSKVETAMAGITLLKAFHYTQRVQIMIKTETMRLQAPIQSTLPCVTKRWMADVVHQSECLCQSLVQSERRCDMPGDLGHLHGVRESTAEVVGCTTREDLRFTREPTESPGLNDAVAVTHKSKPLVSARSRKSTLRKQMLCCSKYTTRM